MRPSRPRKPRVGGRAGRRVAVVAVALVFATTLGWASPVSAAASKIVYPVFSDISGQDAEFEFAALGALGVFGGDRGLGGTVRPDEPITRAEFCKVVVGAMGKAGIAAGLASMAPRYTDGASIPAWAWGYVNTAMMMGVVKADPYGDGTFRPQNRVTHAEAVTMLVRAVPGHDAQVQVSPWPLNYVTYAVTHGFVGRVDISAPNDPCSRADMAIMLLAAMQVSRLDYFGGEVEDSAVLAGRLRRGRLVDYAATDTMNFVSIDLNGDGDLDVGEMMDLAPTVCLARGSSLESLKTLDVRVILGAGDNSSKVLFIGAIYGGISRLFPADRPA